MNIIILSHRRSLNKAEGFIKANKNNNLILVTDAANLDEKFSYLKLISKVYHIKGFDIVNITKKIKQCDSIFCVSENLLPIQSQLESYYVTLYLKVLHPPSIIN
jgi:alkyl sulfatase BDS1-like metallo-beta-lactamase superfamily hydrolase